MNLVNRYNVPREIIINEVAIYNNDFEDSLIFRIRFNHGSGYQYRISNHDLCNARYDILTEMIHNIKRALEKHQLEQHHRRDYVNPDRLTYLFKDCLSKHFRVPDPTFQPVSIETNQNGDITYSQRFSYGAPPINLGRAIATISF